MNKNYSISQEATFTCSATEGKPEAVISAHLGEGEELGDEDLELELDNEVHPFPVSTGWESAVMVIQSLVLNCISYVGCQEFPPNNSSVVHRCHDKFIQNIIQH